MPGRVKQKQPGAGAGHAAHQGCLGHHGWGAAGPGPAGARDPAEFKPARAGGVWRGRERKTLTTPACW